MMRRRTVLGVVLSVRISSPVVAAIVLAASRADAQYGEFTPDRSLRTDARLVLANAGIGAVTAAANRWFRGERGFAALRDGAIGGALAYGGKRLAVERFTGAGFAGRQVGAIGHSVIRNAGDRRPLLRRLVLPVGPFRLYVRPDSVRLRARIDLPTTVYALLASLNDNDLDLHASLSSGAMVFKSGRRPLSDSEGRCLAGFALGGVIVMNDIARLGTDNRNPGYAHERVHVGQYDQLFLTISDPLEEKLAGDATWKRYIDLNLLSPVLLVPALLMPFDELPWEMEAARITRQTFGEAPFPGEDFSHWACTR